MIQKAAILNSRQAFRPCLTNGWVKNSVEAVKWVKKNNFTLCSSVGMSTWELITALSSINKVKLELFLPLQSKDNFETQKKYYIKQFKLNNSLTTFTPVRLANRSKSKEKLWLLRDKKIIEQADIILPVSIKNNGNLDKLCRENISSAKQVKLGFKTAYIIKKKKLGYRISLETVNKKTEEFCKNFFIHWTRSFNSAWPTERLIDYYSSIIESEVYPRSAFDSVKNIVSQKIIIASSKNMPDNISTVSFSNQSLSKMTDLMRWRSRYQQMSFEPYGIGIKKETAFKLGVQKVNYYDKKNPSEISEKNKWHSQSKGEITDWSAESEYRYIGDFDFSKINSDDLIIVTRNQSEADILNKKIGIKTVSFTNE